MRRAVLVSAALSAGFMAVFFVAGVISYNFTNWINQNSKYATVVIGLSLLVLGVAMLFGYKLPFTTPNIRRGDSTKRTVWAMFVFGIAYAVASIGCTIGLFIATVFSASARDGVAAGVGNIVAYGAGHGARRQRADHRARVRQHRAPQGPAIERCSTSTRSPRCS